MKVTPTTTTTYVVGQGTPDYVSVQNDGFYDGLRLEVSTLREDHKGRDERVRIIIKPDAILDFLAQVANQGGAALSAALGDVAKGFCERCSNLRLIDQPRKNGPGTEQVYCPECNPGGRGGSNLLVDVPTVEAARAARLAAEG